MPLWQTLISIISIHAPTRGATSQLLSAFARTRKFQFTPLREGRQSGCVVVYWDIPISIHAPTRGATCARRETRRRLGDFNSRPYARGDCHSQRRIRRSKEYFNSRPYARGDQISCRSYGSSNTISIHAPTRGATCDYENGTRYPSLISIHAPTRGATWRSRK